MLCVYFPKVENTIFYARKTNPRTHYHQRINTGCPQSSWTHCRQTNKQSGHAILSTLISRHQKLRFACLKSNYLGKNIGRKNTERWLLASNTLSVWKHQSFQILLPIGYAKKKYIYNNCFRRYTFFCSVSKGGRNMSTWLAKI